MEFVLFCHFFAWAPHELEFQRCRPRVGNGPRQNTFPRHADLVQHHRRVHPIRPYCGRCGLEFKSQAQEQDHQRLLTPCLRANFTPKVGVGLQQLKDMTNAPTGLTDEQRWYRDLAIIFGPGTRVVNSLNTLIYGHTIDIVTERILLQLQARGTAGGPALCDRTLNAVFHLLESQRLRPQAPQMMPLIQGPPAPMRIADGGAPAGEEAGGGDIPVGEDFMEQFVDYDGGLA
ncbi:hypothetical protein B0T14DRAFT_495625 [Immersiella caudata]|uniref:C2H2-type domain-containing protein n=1 Tax=Immersiella caudata TaxID=314043 RepID=A0AA40C3S6_9PEZI|nr:hypothetical protein B0T14DRAFT_495625 [Immersiella caudata]